MDSNEFHKEKNFTTDTDYAAKHSQPVQPIINYTEEQFLPKAPPPPLPLPPAVRPSKKSSFSLLAKILLSLIVVLIISTGLLLLTRFL